MTTATISVTVLITFVILIDLRMPDLHTIKMEVIQFVRNLCSRVRNLLTYLNLSMKGLALLVAPWGICWVGL